MPAPGFRQVPAGGSRCVTVRDGVAAAGRTGRGFAARLEMLFFARFYKGFEINHDLMPGGAWGRVAAPRIPPRPPQETIFLQRFFDGSPWNSRRRPGTPGPARTGRGFAVQPETLFSQGFTRFFNQLCPNPNTSPRAPWCPLQFEACFTRVSSVSAVRPNQLPGRMRFAVHLMKIPSTC